MKRILALAFLCITLTSAAQDFSLFEKKLFITSDGDSLPYRMLYPEDYNTDISYPLVLFLHGGGERGNDNEKQLIHGVKAFLNPEYRSKYPCIVIVPQCPADWYWASVKFNRSEYPLKLDFNYDYEITEGLKSAIELTKCIRKVESVDKNRVYITGLSMGGMGTFEAVFRFPEMFAAAAVVCGGGDEEAYGKNHAGIPFWLFHGDVDGVIEASNSRKMYKRLKALGADVKYTEYENVNHNSWENAYSEPELLPWMFDQRR